LSWHLLLGSLLSVVQEPQAGQPVVPLPQKKSELSPDKFFKAPRTNLNHFFSRTINYKSKKVYISKTPHLNKRGIRRKKNKKSSFT
jgi:hypothetical protein